MAESSSNDKPLRIAHISDLHAGSRYFVANMLSRTVEELNEMKPDAVLITGDLTHMGFRQEFRTVRTFLDGLACQNVIVVPGNHDARNVGYTHFEEFFGPRHNVCSLDRMTVVGIDSSEPDLDIGRVGRERYLWLEESLNDVEGLRVVALHHHLIPVPGTGRERNIVYDAGDLLEVLIRSQVDLVVHGHKHVPYVWHLENLMVVGGGTVASLRLRGRTNPCYNLLHVGKEQIKIYRKQPFEEQQLIVDFSLKDK
ncbi:MAG: metallophosphoesterase family protein, partial [Terriglobia bacterium]